MKFKFGLNYSHFAIIAIVALMVTSCKQKPNKENKSSTIVSQKDDMDFERALYKQAYSIGDHHTAIVAINRMLLMDSTQTHYYDSLSRHYMAIGNSNSAIHFAEKALLLDPGDVKMLEIAGLIYFDAGAFKQAEEKISKLYQITKQPNYLYSLSQVYTYMGDVKKANEMTDMILKDSSTDDVYVDVNTSDGGVQSVKIKAAAYFVKANLQQTPKSAISFLNKALSLQPNFEIVKAIKEDMEVKIKMKEIQDNEDLIKKYQK